MAFKKKETVEKAAQPAKPAGEAAVKTETLHVGDTMTQRPRLSCTISYKGLIVGGNDYHPEKIDMSHTITIDHVDGETKEQTKARLDDLKVTQELVIDASQLSIAEKVGKIKCRMAALKQEQSQA